MLASPFGPMRSCMKSPRLRLPVWPPMSVYHVPWCTKCSLASGGADPGGPPVWGWGEWNTKPPPKLSGPAVSPLAHAAGLPYHATSTLPGSPAPIHAKTFVLSPGVGSEDTVHVLPWSLEVAYFSRVLPVTAPDAPGACSQTAWRLPALSTDMVGKLPPVTEPGKLDTSLSVQLASPVVAVGEMATTSHRPIEIEVSAALSWTTKTLRPPCVAP